MPQMSTAFQQQKLEENHVMYSRTRALNPQSIALSS